MSQQKGKKFNAAEKHFIEKEIKYQSQIKSLTTTIQGIKSSQAELLHKNQVLTDENTQLKDWVERLLQYTELSEADIKAVCEQDKHRGEAITQFMGMVNMLNRYM